MQGLTRANVTPETLTDAERDVACARGNATVIAGMWTCSGCGKTFRRSPNQHIYAARKRVNARAKVSP